MNVVDDASSDGSVDMVRTAAATTARMRRGCQQVLQGLGSF